jgi:catechol 2,3-dioxygenase-like lactoylglutathione lyase family enzyme
MLQTDDLRRTIAWYESVLGFRRVSPDDDSWCRLVRDDIAIMFMRNDHMGSPHATATQYFYVDDVRAVFESLKDRCSVEWGLERMPYGMLEFAIKYASGYLLSFGQPLG